MKRTGKRRKWIWILAAALFLMFGACVASIEESDADETEPATTAAERFAAFEEDVTEAAAEVATAKPTTTTTKAPTTTTKPTTTTTKTTTTTAKPTTTTTKTTTMTAKPTTTTAKAMATKSATKATTKKETMKATTKKTTTNSVGSRSTESYYVLNTNTKKFHKPSCASAKKISDNNYATSDDSREELIARGYSPCKNCNP